MLTQDELLIYLLETQGFEPEEVSAVFRQLDTDGDGVVTKAEFVAGHAAWRDAGLASQSWGAHGEVVLCLSMDFLFQRVVSFNDIAYFVSEVILATLPSFISHRRSDSRWRNREHRAFSCFISSSPPTR